MPGKTHTTEVLLLTMFESLLKKWGLGERGLLEESEENLIKVITQNEYVFVVW